MVCLSIKLRVTLRILFQGPMLPVSMHNIIYTRTKRPGPEISGTWIYVLVNFENCLRKNGNDVRFEKKYIILIIIQLMSRFSWVWSEISLIFCVFWLFVYYAFMSVSDIGCTMVLGLCNCMYMWAVLPVSLSRLLVVYVVYTTGLQYVRLAPVAWQVRTGQ